MKHIYTFVCLFLFSSVVAGDQWLCIPDRAIGFVYNEVKQKWTEASFKVEEKRWIISESESAGYAYEVNRFGKDNLDLTSLYCKEDFSEYGYLSCDGAGELRFNRDNLRYIKTYTLGYFNVLPDVNKIADADSDTPSMEIGKCSSF